MVMVQRILLAVMNGFMSVILGPGQWAGGSVLGRAKAARSLGLEEA